MCFTPNSTCARGTEALTDARALLDTTPWGRQQDFEESPPGWPRAADDRRPLRKLRQSQPPDLNYNSCHPRHLRIMVQAAGV